VSAHTSSCPLRVAQCSGVLRFASTELMQALRSSNSICKIISEAVYTDCNEQYRVAVYTGCSEQYSGAKYTDCNEHYSEAVYTDCNEQYRVTVYTDCNEQ